MNKKIVLLIFCFINSYSYYINAQNQTIINYGDKAKINIYSENNEEAFFPSIFQDYDNLDENWLAISKPINQKLDSLLLINVDNNLNIKKIIRNKGQILDFKKNNKSYGISHNYINNSDYYDSIFFHCNDSIGNNIITTLIRARISDSLLISSRKNKAFVNNENEIVLVNYCGIDSTSTLRISVIDTLGKIKQSKNVINFPWYIQIFDVYETFGTYDFVFLREPYNTRVYSYDKNSLNLLDSVDFDSVFFPAYIKQINDSIYVVTSDLNSYLPGQNNIDINIINRKSLERKDIFLPINYYENYTQDYIPLFGQRIDFTNPDSIYFCYYISSVMDIYNPVAGSNYIDIANFGINGNLNFRYRIDYDSTALFKQVNGIKATSDGGAIITCVLQNCAWVIKFMPNGFVGLSNVESGESASLRVYPNPAKDFVSVDIEADRFGKADIEIYDLGGRMVKKSKLTVRLGNRIDVSNLNAGVYTYRVVLNGKGASGKIVLGE